MILIVTLFLRHLLCEEERMIYIYLFSSFSAALIFEMHQEISVQLLSIFVAWVPLVLVIILRVLS